MSKIRNGRLIYTVLGPNKIYKSWEPEIGVFCNELISLIDEKKREELIQEWIDDYKPNVNRKTMINMLGLQPFASKEEILKELNEIL